jgi:hypothetical protein
LRLQGQKSLNFGQNNRISIRFASSIKVALQRVARPPRLSAFKPSFGLRAIRVYLPCPFRVVTRLLELRWHTSKAIELNPLPA